MGGKWAVSLAVALIAGPSFAESPGSVTLVEALRQKRQTIAMTAGRLSGPGVEFILDAAGHSQFVVIGEPHNAAEVPQVASALLDLLRARYGFDHLALEQDPVMCRIVSEKGVAGDHHRIVDLARNYPYGFTFNTDQEIDLIAHATSIVSGAGDAVWGIDQVFGVSHLLDRLMPFAPDATARGRTEALLSVARPREQERSENSPHYLASAATPADFADLPRLYHPRQGSEAGFLISQLLLSLRIFDENNRAGRGETTGWASNEDREENMKTLFMTEYRRSQARGERLPKVLLKAGTNHAIRGRGWTDVLTVGNFVAELAKSNGLESFHLAIYLDNDSGDYGVLSSYPDYKPLADAALPESWTLIDLRSLRPLIHAGRITDLNSELKRVILGFDAALLIRGATRGTRAFTATAR